MPPCSPPYQSCQNLISVWQIKKKSKSEEEGWREIKGGGRGGGKGGRGKRRRPNLLKNTLPESENRTREDGWLDRKTIDKDK